VPALCCIVTCKGRLEHLRQTLPGIAKWPDVEVVVVDYDCPQQSARWVRVAHPAVKTVRVEDRPTFNLSAARNLGAQAAAGDWLLFLDADTLAAPDLPGHLTPLMRPGVFAVAEPGAPQLWGALLVSRADFARLEGYDEAIEGWGSEDEDMIERLIDAGLERTTFKSDLLTPIPHDERLRTEHYAVKDRTANNRLNHLYRRVKRDLALLNVSLPLESRRSLYRQLRPVVFGGSANSVEISFRRSALGERVVLSSLKYDLVPAEAAAVQR